MTRMGSRPLDPAWACWRAEVLLRRVDSGVRAAAVALAVGAAAAGCHVQAQAQEGGLDVSGNVIVYGESRRPSHRGPLAEAHAIDPTVVLPATGSSRIEATLKATVDAFNASVTFRGASSGRHDSGNRAVLNELGYSVHWDNALLSAGKKVVSWDIGYAFRPNDLVQQEARRPLVQRTLEGRPLLMLEGFGDDSAWSVVGFEKKPRAQDAAPLAPSENVIAARLYKRKGAADLYAFGASGSRTGASIGGAFSWVLTDSIELHASYRRVGRYNLKALIAPVDGLARLSPYATVRMGSTDQALIGMTWTNESKLSLIAEAWFDGTAPSDASWNVWSRRNDTIRQLSGRGGLGAGSAIAGNLGWQAGQLSATPLRRTQLFLRTSWTYERWEPALDFLYSPADRGLVITLGVGWKSDKARLDVGARAFGGAKNALYAQVPYRSVIYLGLTTFF